MLLRPAAFVLRTAFVLLTAFTASAAAAEEKPPEEAKVIWKERYCSFFIVQSSWGFTLFEHLNGPWPNDNDLIVGKLDGFGTRNVVNKTADNQLTLVYSEISSTSKRWVAKKIPGFCRRKKDLLAQIEQESGKTTTPAGVPAPAAPATPPAASPAAGPETSPAPEASPAPAQQ
jgi:hypothetical protein